MIPPAVSICRLLKKRGKSQRNDIDWLIDFFLLKLILPCYAWVDKELTFLCILWVLWLILSNASNPLRADLAECFFSPYSIYNKHGETCFCPRANVCFPLLQTGLQIHVPRVLCVYVCTLSCLATPRLPSSWQANSIRPNISCSSLTPPQYVLHRAHGVWLLISWFLHSCPGNPLPVAPAPNTPDLTPGRLNI